MICGRKYYWLFGEKCLYDFGHSGHHSFHRAKELIQATKQLLADHNWTRYKPKDDYWHACPYCSRHLNCYIQMETRSKTSPNQEIFYRKCIVEMILVCLRCAWTTDIRFRSDGMPLKERIQQDHETANH